MAHDYRRADLDPRVRALCDFAVRLTREPASVSREEIATLREHGWSDAGIHDAIQVVAFFNYINRVADAVGIGPEPEWSGDDGAPR